MKTSHSLPEELKHSQLPKKLQVQTNAAGEARLHLHSTKHIETPKTRKNANREGEWRDMKGPVATQQPAAFCVHFHSKDMRGEQVTPVVNMPLASEARWCCHGVYMSLKQNMDLI